jgi:hypothetical protein
VPVRPEAGGTPDDRRAAEAAYEADAIDPVTNLGWSVMVVGVAHQVTDPAAAAAFRRALHHWADDANDQVISISPGVVTGFRVLPETTAKASQ